MKSYIRFLVLTALFTAVCLLVLLISVPQPDQADADDILQFNNTVQTVKEHWNDTDFLAETYADEALAVFSADGFLLYASKSAAGIGSVTDAVQNGYICMPVTENGSFLGTAALRDMQIRRYERIRQRIFFIAAAVFLLILLVLAAAGFYIQRRIVKPFRQMQLFAGKIADGVLDEPLMMERSNMFGVFTESFDMMREALKESQQREEDLKQREKELIASLSHDMKTPVTGIKLLCELTEVKSKDLYVIDKVQNISQKAEQLNILVSDLLSSALDDLGEMHVTCLDQSADVLHMLVKEHDTRGLVREESVPECLICIDRNRLSQVIANIISNSYKYADTEIDVHYQFSGRFLQMDIADHGSGIPEDELPLITTKFYRGKENTEGREGSGLGLYIAAALTEKMNGHLICSNSDGLTVTLMLPLS